MTENTTTTSAIEVLPHKEDRYHGVIVSANKLPSEVNDFVERLEFSLTVWRLALKRGVWLKIPIEICHFIPYAVKLGFVYHHAEKDYLMLTTWLSDLENHLPINATHQVGVGCVVFNFKHELLLVQEKNGILGGLDLWKVPTGLLDAGEDIPQAAVREVMEETGIKATFKAILSFRQLHGMAFGKSDLFFMCLLELESEAETEITHQESEIAKAEWMDAIVYANQKFMLESPAHAQLNVPIMREHRLRLARENRVSGDAGEGSGEEMLVIDYGRYANGFKPGDAAIYSIAKRV